MGGTTGSGPAYVAGNSALFGLACGNLRSSVTDVWNGRTPKRSQRPPYGATGCGTRGVHGRRYSPTATGCGTPSGKDLVINVAPAIGRHAGRAVLSRGRGVDAASPTRSVSPGRVSPIAGSVDHEDPGFAGDRARPDPLPWPCEQPASARWGGAQASRRPAQGADRQPHGTRCLEGHHASGPQRVHLLGRGCQAGNDPRTPHSPDPGGAGGRPASALLLARVQAPRAHRRIAVGCVPPTAGSRARSEHCHISGRVHPRARGRRARRGWPGR